MKNRGVHKLVLLGIDLDVAKKLVDSGITTPKKIRKALVKELTAAGVTKTQRDKLKENKKIHRG